MEKLIFQSPKKHRIIAIKKLLIENDIPISNIKLYIYVEWNHGGRKGGKGITQYIEKRDILDLPIEDFNEKLNDSQTFEIYTDDKYEDKALEIIENINIGTFFGDCIFKSVNYDETFEKYLLLTKRNIPCDDVFINNEEYLLFADPENRENAMNILEKFK
jgi:hypothetical protein